MSDEITRLRRVYRDYQKDAARRAEWSPRNPGNAFILDEKKVVLRSYLRKFDLIPLVGRRVLDVGCGSGHSFASLLEFGAAPRDLFGVDLLESRVSDARAHYPRSNFACGNAEHLDFGSGHFDLVIAFTLFSSILDDRMSCRLAEEIRRVLKVGGAVIWYDLRYDNPWNPNVRGVPRREIANLFPDLTRHLRPVTLMPQIARRLGPATKILYPILSGVPFLRTHYVGLLRSKDR
jgi:SAM-dependent methyltransferase